MEDGAADEADEAAEAEELPTREDDRDKDDDPAAEELPPTLEEAAEEAVPPLEELLLESPLVLVHPVRPSNPATASQHALVHVITLSSALRRAP